MLIMQNHLQDTDEQLNFFVQDMEEQLETSEFLKNSYQDRLLHFHKYVNRLHDGNYTYLEAILEFSKEYDLEYTDCVKLISPSLLGLIEMECTSNNQLKSQDIGRLGL
jgi:hypothetical protein